MKKRKKFLIDNKFQLKQTAYITCIFSIIVIIIIGITSAVLYINNQKLITIARQQQGLNDIQAEIMKSLTVFSEHKTWDNLHLATDKAAKDLEETQKKLNHNITLTREITLFNNALIIIILIILVVMNILLFVLFIRRMHRISGPIYVLTDYLKKMLKGKYPEVKSLRKNDELKELFDLFRQVVNSLKDKVEKKKSRVKPEKRPEAKR